jgi:L-ascorbate metabolism protein UlaG (beta-lactamase superfamily)
MRTKVHRDEIEKENTTSFEALAANRTSSDLMFLRADAKLELLAGRWFAWSHLLAPVQHAMNVTNRHLPMLRSFIANPAVHAAASKDPMLLGGAFLDLDASEVPAIRELLDRTLVRYAGLVELANDLQEFDRRLQRFAKGPNLDMLYRELPRSLRGMVELVYDANNHPSIFLREELFYQEFGTAHDWDEICVHLTPDRERRMFISTPLLPREDRVFIATDFAARRVDLLSAARFVGQSFQEIIAAFDLDVVAAACLSRCFTSEPPTRNAPQYRDAGLRLRYFGHACVLVQTVDVSILVDPFCAYERDAHMATLTFDDLPDFIDYVVISHGHHDHLLPEMLLQLRTRIGEVLVPAHCGGNIVDPSLKLILSKLGLVQVREVRSFESTNIPHGAITSLPLPGEHCGLNVHGKQSVAVRLGNRNILFLADSDAADPDLYVRIARCVGKVDVLFIGMECHGAPLSWFYGPLLTRPLSRRDDESRRGNGCDCARAWSVIRELGCSRVFVYAMGMEPWTRHLLGLEFAQDSIQIRESDKLIAMCAANGIRAERLQGCMELQWP